LRQSKAQTQTKGIAIGSHWDQIQKMLVGKPGGKHGHFTSGGVRWGIMAQLHENNKLIHYPTNKHTPINSPCAQNQSKASQTKFNKRSEAKKKIGTFSEFGETL